MKFPTREQFDAMPAAERVLWLIRVEAYRAACNAIDRLYLETGDRRRDLYRKHLAFFRAGTKYKERAAMAANQIGKSFGMGAYETALHLTGMYPDWWDGRRFKTPIAAIAAGKTTTTTRDIIQAYLFGKVQIDGDRKVVTGTGLIRKECIGRVIWKKGTEDAIDTAMIKHASGGQSILSLRAYEQGRGAFEGLVRHWIWLDEEPSAEIYSECLIRTATTDGSIIGTFTPLDGITETVKMFLPAEKLSQFSQPDAERLPEVVSGLIHVNDSRCTVMVGWDDVPHLDDKARADLLRGVQDHEIKARSLGIPSVGDGAIFPVDEAKIRIDPISIPAHWPRIIGLDFGWDHPTAFCVLTYDRDSDTIYVIADYAQSRTTIPIHASAIKGRGTWIPVAWPHDGYSVKDQTNGEQLAQQYRNEGVNMRPVHAQFPPTPGSKERVSTISVEAGLQEMLTRMQTGRWKVFSTCEKWFEEFRLYRRETKKMEDGCIQTRIIKVNDDVISASRYALMDIRYAECEPQEVSRATAAAQYSPRRDWRFSL